MLERWVAELRSSPELAAHADALVALIRPRIALAPRPAKQADREIGASRLGGTPDLARGAAWPQGRFGPIDFVGQLNLGELALRDVDQLLPREGVLGFFCCWTEELWDFAVVLSPVEDLEPQTFPGEVSRSRRPAKLQGITFSADAVLAPPASRFVAADTPNWRPTRYDPDTGTYVSFEPVVALPGAAHEAYGRIYDGWLESVGWSQHGLFGYDRNMECEQAPDEVMLLRLDDDGTIAHDFIEAACLDFLIGRDALETGDFGRARAHYGASI